MTIDVTTITAAQFKAQFTRGLPYFSSIQYDPTKLYNAGNEVYYSATQLFYTAITNNVQNAPPDQSPAQWAQTADDADNYVQDTDIQNAFIEAQAVFNPSLYSGDQTVQLAYLYLTAHYLSNDLRAAMGGVGAPAAFPVSNRSVGNVSEGYTVPDAYSEDPTLAFYTSSSYGMKYLSMTLPSLHGNMAGVYGHAQA